MKKIFFFLAAALVLQACKTTQEKDYRQQSTGTLNSLAVVISNDMWNGRVGDTIREYFAAPVDGLATEEAIFSIHQIPPGVFTDFARTSRNILIIQKSEENIAGISQDLYASPQEVAIIKGADEDKIIELLTANARQMVENFKKHELIEAEERMVTSKSKEKQVLDAFGYTIKLPSTYIITTQINTPEDKFFWIRRQIQKYEGGILLYEIPYNEVPNDSTLTDMVVNVRDSIGRKHVPGPEPETMYMVTEKGFAPSIQEFTLNGRRVIESRGLWEMKDYMMGGPYVNYMIEDKANNRYVVIDGFVFAPSIDKRDYMFELEAIAKSIKFKEDKDFDKQEYSEE